MQKLSFEKQKIEQNEIKAKVEIKVQKLQHKNVLLDGSAKKRKKKASGE